MLRSRRFTLVATMALGLVSFVACGGDDSDPSSGTTATGSLSGICPDQVVIQTDWFPEAEHGTVYQLLGDDYRIDVDTKRVTGSLIDADGSDTGVDVQIRAGGPAIGGTRVVEAMSTDSDITLGFVNTDSAAFNHDTIATLAVVGTLEKNPQMLMWDPETYPDVKSIADLGRQGITINVFSAGSFLDVFVATGVLQKSQLDPSYDGSPARFIAEGGRIAQQGFASAEPYLYEKTFTEWGRPVSYQLLHDAGFQIYAQPLAIRAADKDALAPCLKKLVPLVQRASVAYLKDGSRANQIIVEAVAKFDTFWVYEQGVADFSTGVQRELGLVGNGDDDTIDNFDLDRVNQVLAQLRDAGLDVPE
ncbi:MAG: ABC transporter substrate-binding protein, partial [Actinomycetota bacterium]